MRSEVRKSHLRRTVGAVAVTALMVAGCSSLAQSPASSHAAGLRPPSVPPSPAPPPSTPSAALSLPLDPYLTASTRQAAVLNEALAIKTRDCMVAKGFSYPISASSNAGTSVAPGFAELASVYGISNLAMAEADGYGPAAQGHVSFGSAHSLPTGTMTLPGLVRRYGAAYVVALYGYAVVPPPGTHTLPGCSDKASTSVYAAYGAANRNLPAELGSEATQATEANKRVLAVEAAWSTCMAGRGFQYSSPLAAAQAKWPTPPSGLEITTAVADVRCKQKTDLTGVVLAVMRGYQQELVQANILALTQLNRDFARIVTEAEAIVTSSRA